MSANLNLPDPAGMDTEDIPAAIAQLSACQAQLAARLLIERKPEKEEEDSLLTLQEACEMLHVKKSWLYERSKNLPFIRRLSGKKTLYSKKGILSWMAKRR